MRSSDAGPDDPNVAIDPDNRYLWRMNLRRMEGEVVRDSVLFLAGRLDPKMGGPDQPVASAEAGTRRTPLLPLRQRRHIPFLTMFDAAERDGVLPPPRDDRAAAGAGLDQQRDGL